MHLFCAGNFMPFEIGFTVRLDGLHECSHRAQLDKACYVYVPYIFLEVFCRRRYYGHFTLVISLYYTHQNKTGTDLARD